ncbi:MAG TPA: DUF4249 domain-containing protein [Flavobacterium sp.]|uniref:DUF4249 domain-containing protein n=1 Tax=Flavobacterium sp. TaxID=239 RepID=UPI002B4B0E9E|nr:DUF4249 domain-containing protein [Flavobacterium sp.]HLO73012.1 DUF4249 domain-containing protein [Flavobacterium sp.]
MKTIYKILVLLLTLSFFSCEDVVDINLDTAPPKLVIDASIKWEKGTAGNEQIIKLTTTTDYYSSTIPVVSGATVFVTDGNGIQYDFTETLGTGNYVCTNFNPEINQTYVLTVVNNGEIYTATEQLIGVPTVDSVTQNNNGGFTGDEIEVKFYFQDNGLIDNFYLIQFNSSFTTLPEYDVIDDEFFQGNQMFGLYTNEDMKAADELQFTLHGVSERYYNYMNVILGIAGGNGGSPFQTPPATVRGNIINQTNFDNFALGYFRLSETDSETYIVQ